jgi:glycosyltransferase 2 family protein
MNTAVNNILLKKKRKKIYKRNNNNIFVMNKRTKTALIILSIFFGGFLLYKVFEQTHVLEVIAVFAQAPLHAVLLFILISIIMMCLHTYRWYLIVKKTTKKIPFFTLLRYKLSGFGVSFITPGAKIGGEALRASLMRRHGSQFKRGFTTVMIDKLIEVSTIGVLFVVAVIIILASIPVPGYLATTLAILAGICIAIIIYFYHQMLRDKHFFLKIFRFLRLHKIKKLEPVERRIIDFERLMASFYKEHKKTFIVILIITVITWLLMFVEYMLVLTIIGLTGVSIIKIFFIITMMGIAYMIPVPLALGVLEAGQAGVFMYFGLPVAASVGLSMLIRFRDLGWTVLGFISLGLQGLTWKQVEEESLKEGELALEKDKEEENLFKEVKSKTKKTTTKTKSKKTSVIKKKSAITKKKKVNT